jgi:thiol-disulfide isomerase/thioredoxin
VTAAAAAATAPRPAPAVSGVDPVTGKAVRLADYRGRVVVVNAWASWCGGCIAEAKDLRAFARAHPRVAILGVNAEDSRTGARAFAARYGFRWPSIFDPKGVVARRLGVRGLPTTLFLDRRHRVVAEVAGAGTRRQFEDGLRRAMRGG